LAPYFHVPEVNGEMSVATHSFLKGSLDEAKAFEAFDVLGHTGRYAIL
jgi:hypothetical protein